MVWVRAGVATSLCPESIITAGSLKFLEVHSASGVFPQLVSGDQDARTIDALVVLDRESKKENYSEHN